MTYQHVDRGGEASGDDRRCVSAPMLWPGQRFETRRYGIVEIVDISERSPYLTCRCWLGASQVFALQRNSSVILSITPADLHAEVIRPITRYQAWSASWVDAGVDPRGPARRGSPHLEYALSQVSAFASNPRQLTMLGILADSCSGRTLGFSV